MSELINKQDRSDFRWQLLTTVSALSLALVLSSPAVAGDKPSVWIELGGQLERLEGGQDAVLPPFTQLSPTPGPYFPISPTEAQKPSIYSYGAEGKISFRPDVGDWDFTASVRYGRSNSKKRLHQQSFATSVAHLPPGLLPSGGTEFVVSIPQFADYRTRNEESHFVLDFTAGRDVGIGSFGREGTSNISAGIRFADFAAHSSANIIARPKIDFREITILIFHVPTGGHNDYFMSAESARSFHGVGPTLSWDASATVVGTRERGSITADWGLNAGLLFGRQKASGNHSVQARYYSRGKYNAYYDILYDHPTPHNRSRSVVVPNVGGFAGISFRYPNAAVSLGYRADFFFGAMDVGIDARHTADRNFYGPFATISIGLP
jgi:hypothetical protein